MARTLFIKKLSPAICASISLILTESAIAQDSSAVEYPSAVKVFQEFCLAPELGPDVRLSRIGTNENWTEDSIVTVDVRKMGISRSISGSMPFSKPLNARQWTGKVDGKDARVVMASFDTKKYRNLCALVLEGPSNAMPYGRELKAAFKEFGIGAKSVDLVHYYEFAGKVGPDKHRVRGEIFSRSLSGQIKETTHLYIQY